MLQFLVGLILTNWFTSSFNYWSLVALFYNKYQLLQFNKIYDLFPWRYIQGGGGRQQVEFAMGLDEGRKTQKRQWKEPRPCMCWKAKSKTSVMSSLAGTIGRDFSELFLSPWLTLSPSAGLRTSSDTLYSPQTGISTSALSFFSPKTFKTAADNYQAGASLPKGNSHMSVQCSKHTCVLWLHLYALLTFFFFFGFGFRALLIKKNQIPSSLPGILLITFQYLRNSGGSESGGMASLCHWSGHHARYDHF